MRLLLNGDERDLDQVSSVADLVAALGLDSRKVAVERNLEIVPRSTYADTRLAEGDRIEIVTFIGGG
jgi:thiamine biosynthesis protein ThiS